MLRMDELFDRQVCFQEELTAKQLPQDSPTDFQYHLCLMVEELGELAKTDKRWREKDGLQTKPEGIKLDELADVMIVAMNLMMFSGYDYEDILAAIDNKIAKNEGRLPK